jgi:predicted transposase YbfD/YdcC
LILRPVEPIAIDFAFARTLVAVQSRRTEKKTGKTTFETRYYLSSQQSAERSHEGWINLIRGHWGGIENRNHWRRDALCGEDRTRSRNPNLVANSPSSATPFCVCLTNTIPIAPCLKSANASPPSRLRHSPSSVPNYDSKQNALAGFLGRASPTARKDHGG